MHIRRRALALTAVALIAATVASTGPVSAQDQKVDKKVLKAQQEELQATIKLGDAAGLGQPVANDFTMSMTTDFMKAQEGRAYVPFTITIPAEPAPPSGLMFYLRVTDKNPPAPAPAPADKKDGKKDAKKGPEYAFEDAYPVDLKAAEPGQPFRFSRAFTVKAGEYSVVMVLKERAPIEKDKKVKNPVYKTAVLKQDLSVPEFWGGNLVTSSVIMASDVGQLQVPLTPQEAKEQPYTLGNTKIVPVASNKLKKKGELSVVFIVYNTQFDTNKKPDVAVEYAFYQKVATEPNGEKFFNKTNPQNFNAQTLPPQFDTALGHQLVAGQSIPLGSFPEGDYRLEVKVTDKLAGKTLTHNVPFSVGS
jgi:hypothetical protein